MAGTEELMLPFELPEHMSGLEGFIIDKATKYATGENGAIDPKIFDTECRIWATETDHRLRGYYALARIATNPNSLPYKIKSLPWVTIEPPQINFWEAGTAE